MATADKKYMLSAERGQSKMVKNALLTALLILASLTRISEAASLINSGEKSYTKIGTNVLSMQLLQTAYLNFSLEQYLFGNVSAVATAHGVPLQGFTLTRYSVGGRSYVLDHFLDLPFMSTDGPLLGNFVELKYGSTGIADLQIMIETVEVWIGRSMKVADLFTIDIKAGSAYVIGDSSTLSLNRNYVGFGANLGFVF